MGPGHGQRRGEVGVVWRLAEAAGPIPRVELAGTPGLQEDEVERLLADRRATAAARSAAVRWSSRSPAGEAFRALTEVADDR